MNTSFLSQPNENNKKFSDFMQSRAFTSFGGEILDYKGCRLRRKSCECAKCGKPTKKQLDNMLEPIKTKIKQFQHLEIMKSLNCSLVDYPSGSNPE